MASKIDLTEFTLLQTNQTDHPIGKVDDLRFDWIMAIASIWWLGGLFVDGWAHSNLPRLETFFTPWHAILYSGFLAVATTLVMKTVNNLQQAAPSGRTDGKAPFWVMMRRSIRGAGWLQAIPTGYELSLLGVVIFAVSGVGDLTWHMLFGIERDIEALLSPTHLGLALGVGLALSGPLRAAWHRQDSVERSSWRQLLPALLSLTFTLSLLTFFTEYASPLVHPWATADANIFDGNGAALGITDILLQTGLLMGFVLLALRRWRLPMGTFTFVFTLNAGLMAAFRPDVVVFLLPSVLLGGLATDLLYRRLRPSEASPERVRLFAFMVPAILYLLYFLNLAIAGATLWQSSIRWSVHFWAGSIVMAGIVGFLLSYVMIPPTKKASHR